jgi:GAF domain-containing protein
MGACDPTPEYDDDLSHLTQLLLSAESFDAFLNELVMYTSEQTEHSCSITLQTRDAAPYTAVSTDDVTLQLDEQQYADQRGPCMEALSAGQPVFVDDMRNETRWLPYPVQAAELGVLSSMAYPLITAEQTVGALNLYAFKTLAPDPARRGRAEQLADRAAGALAVGLRMSEQSAETTSLRSALASRSLVDQAIGILMGQQHCSAEAAFDLMRKTSQARNIKLRDVAAQLVEGIERRSPDRRGGRY